MDNFELLNIYYEQTNSSNSSEHTDYTDYSDHLDYDSYNTELDLYADVDVSNYDDIDWGGTHGYDGYPEHCTSHEDCD